MGRSPGGKGPNKKRKTNDNGSLTMQQHNINYTTNTGATSPGEEGFGVISKKYSSGTSTSNKNISYIIDDYISPTNCSEEGITNKLDESDEKQNDLKQTIQKLTLDIKEKEKQIIELTKRNCELELLLKKQIHNVSASNEACGLILRGGSGGGGGGGGGDDDDDDDEEADNNESEDEDEDMNNNFSDDDFNNNEEDENNETETEDENDDEKENNDEIGDENDELEVEPPQKDYETLYRNSLSKYLSLYVKLKRFMESTVETMKIIKSQARTHLTNYTRDQYGFFCAGLACDSDIDFDCVHENETYQIKQTKHPAKQAFKRNRRKNTSNNPQRIQKYTTK